MRAAFQLSVIEMLMTEKKKETVVVHLSDLHFGGSFQPEKWKSLAAVAKDAAPDLVVVTGDIVNSPWRWELKRAATALRELRGELRRNDGKGGLELFVVPGNHDTRYTGLFALRWAIYLFVFFALIAVGCELIHFVWLAGALGVIALLFLCLRFAVSSNLAAYLDDMLLTDFRQFPKIGVGIIGFDSATEPRFGAHGRLAAGVISGRLERAFGPVDAAKPRAEEREAPLFWIAAVHHHPLPIPYDSKYESVMIMENAGTLLQELLVREVPLVLHGHKHHRHFARLRTRLHDGSDREISVLAAGSPTEDNASDKRPHSFNVLRITNDHRVLIDVYEAPSEEGSFKLHDKIHLTSEHEYAQRGYARLKDSKSLYCSRMFHSALINESGDALLAREFTGVKTKSTISEFPYDFPATCKQGGIHTAKAYISTNLGPTASTRFGWLSNLDATCRVSFGERGLKIDDEPIDFYMSYQADNAFALDSLQYGYMYPGYEGERTEHMIYSVPECLAVEELYLQLRFPSGSSIPQKLDLEKAHSRDAASHEWSRMPSGSVTFVHSSSMVLARIAAPDPGSAYRFLWEVPTKSWVRTALHKRLEGGLDAVRARLSTMDAPLLAVGIQNFLSAVRGLASKSLAGDPAREADLQAHLAACLFAYDRQMGRLNPIGVAGRPEQSIQSYGYGMGLPGRAFKTGEVTVFDPEAPDAIRGQTVVDDKRLVIERRPDWANRVTVGQLTGQNGAASAPEIAPSAAVAFPMFCEGESEQPFAVLLLSFDGFTGLVRLSDTYSERSLSEVSAGAHILLAKLIDETILGTPRGAASENRR